MPGDLFDPFAQEWSFGSAFGDDGFPDRGGDGVVFDGGGRAAGEVGWWFPAHDAGEHGERGGECGVVVARGGGEFYEAGEQRSSVRVVAVVELAAECAGVGRYRRVG